MEDELFKCLGVVESPCCRAPLPFLLYFLPTFSTYSHALSEQIIELSKSNSIKNP